MQTLLPYLNRALRNYFNQQPAYVLREDGSRGEAMAKKLAKGIEVKPCEIVIPFTDYHEGAFAPLFFVQRKTFPLILCVRQKHPFSRSIEINDCTILCFKDPPPRRLAPSPPRWRHVKNCRAVYQRNLWTGYRNAQSGSARDHRRGCRGVSPAYS